MADEADETTPAKTDGEPTDNNDNDYGDGDGSDSGFECPAFCSAFAPSSDGEFLENSTLRSTIFLICLMCYIFPNTIGYGFNNIQEYCVRYEEDNIGTDYYEDYYNSCQLKTSGYILSFICILLSLLILNLPNMPLLSALPNFMDGMVGMIIRIVLGVFLAICALLLLAGEALHLSWLNDTVFEDNDYQCVSCGLAFLYMLGYLPMFLVSADLMTSFANNQSLRILSFAVIFFISSILGIAHYYDEEMYDLDEDNPYTSLFNLFRSGLVFMFISSILIAVLQVITMIGFTQKLPNLVQILVFRAVSCFFAFSLVLMLVTLGGSYESASCDFNNTSMFGCSALFSIETAGPKYYATLEADTDSGTNTDTGYNYDSYYSNVRRRLQSDEYNEWPILTGSIVGDFMSWPLCIFTLLVAFDFASQVGGDGEDDDDEEDGGDDGDGDGGNDEDADGINK